MIYNECDCDLNKSFENKNIEIQGSTDIVIIQGDTNRREIAVDIDMELIEGIYFSCKDLDLNKKCIRGDKCFILEFSPTETQDLPIYTGTYDLTLKMFEGSIKTICLDQSLMVLEKKNKVDYNADDNTQEIVVVLNLPEQTIIPDKNKTVTKITIPNSLLEDKETNSSFEEQVITKGEEYYGLNEVKIKPIETETKEVELDFSTSDTQRVFNTKDKAMTEVAIRKPITLISDNIKKGINIGGIDGSYEIKLQSKEITITQNGESEIIPDEGYALSKVTVTTNFDGNTLKTLLDATKSCYYLFYKYRGVSAEELIGGDDTSEVTTMYCMFLECSNLTSIPFMNTSKVTNMQYIFRNCSNLTTIPLLDTSNVTNIENIFTGCKKLKTIPLLNTSNVTNMSSMFNYCSELTTIPLLDTSNVTSMNNMFNGCSNLTTIPQLDTSKVTSMNSTFISCSNLKSILMTGMKVNFNISASTKFEREDLVIILNNLATVTTTRTLTMGTTNLAKLTEEDIKIATDKGWTLA